jgi:glutathione S-transferase
VKLYMHPVATTCRPARLFIAENGIPVEEEIVDIFAGAQYVAPYAEANPNSLVPMLVDGDLRLTESSAILKYLADRVDSPAYPREIKLRAKVNEAMDWINTNFYREFGYGLCYPQLFAHLKRRSDEAQAETLEMGKEQSKRWFKVLDTHWLGPTKTVLCGDRITIADYFGACLVSIGETIKVDYSAYPNIERWLATIKCLSSWPKVNGAFYDLVESAKDRTFVTVP